MHSPCEEIMPYQPKPPDTLCLMGMLCNINAFNKCNFVNFVTIGHRNDGRRVWQETVRGAAVPTDPAATGPVADPDGRGAWHFAKLYQPDRAQPAAGHRAIAAAPRRDL